MIPRVDSSRVERIGPPMNGGSIPTSTLQLRKAEWRVETVSRAAGEALVIAHHYARGAANTATHLHGLRNVTTGRLVGVAWWIPPTKSAAQSWAGERWRGVLALSRLVIEPGVPSNACTFLISKSVRMLDPRWHTLVSYADSWRGHTGAIYRAAGWSHCGETKPEAVFTLNGRMTARKAGPKTRTHGEMIAMGCTLEGRFSKSRFVLRR